MNNNRIEKLLPENHAEPPSYALLNHDQSRRIMQTHHHHQSPPPYTLLNHDQSIEIPKDNDYHNEYEYDVQVGCFPDTECGKRSKRIFTVCIAIILVVCGLIAVVLLYNFFSCFAQVNDGASNDKSTPE